MSRPSLPTNSVEEPIFAICTLCLLYGCTSPQQQTTEPDSPVAIGGGKILPGTVLGITVAGNPDLDGRYEVDDASIIHLGSIGPITIGFDKTPDEVARKIKEVIEDRHTSSATVTVTVLGREKIVPRQRKQRRGLF